MKRVSRMSSYSSPLSMVHRSGDSLVVKSVVSGNRLYDTGQEEVLEDSDLYEQELELDVVPATDVETGTALLPDCKIKRNYTCIHCTYYTQNPRNFLYHLKELHGEKIRIYECPYCIYASKHSQKLQRHIRMVHTSNSTSRGVKGLVAQAQTARKSAKGTKINASEKNVMAKVYIPNLQKLANMANYEQNSAPVALAVEPEVQIDLTEAEEAREQAEEELLEDVDYEAELEAETFDEPPVVHRTRSNSVGVGYESMRKMPSREISDYKCSVCYFTSKSKILIQRHEQVAHLKKKFFRCSKCNYVTYVKARYTKHVKYHSMPMIKCDMCDFRTPYKWNLDRHYKNHMGDGTFKCTMCNFTAHIKQSLTVHIQNHHLSPEKAKALRRRNKVGASDEAEAEIDRDELELLRMEREEESLEAGRDDEGVSEGEEDSFEVSSFEVPPGASAGDDGARPVTETSTSSGKNPKIKITLKKTKSAKQTSGSDEFVHPDDVASTNGKMYKLYRCEFCHFKSNYESDVALHNEQHHSVTSTQEELLPAKAKKVVKPIPNLIPIGNDNKPAPTILKIPQVTGRSASGVAEEEEDEVVDLYAANSDDGVELGGDDVPSADVKDERADSQTSASNSGKEVQNSRSPQKKKHSLTFFESIKEKFPETDLKTLICNYCGHVSKCLSESIRHQKLHLSASASYTFSATYSSNRCQFCRQRCKTSADLVNHLKHCEESKRKLEESSDVEAKEDTSCGDEGELQIDEDPKRDEEAEGSLVLAEDSTDVPSSGPHPMEYKVFVWNNVTVHDVDTVKTECQEDGHSVVSVGEESRDASVRSKSPSEGSLVGFETAPGIGAVSSRGFAEGNDVETTPAPVATSTQAHSTTKKVYRCPQCSFWATTASRFHVHVVGHYNKKPFECSECAYRSNWRWDITKHIKLKSARDSAHSRAKVLMTDETGERNYEKYDRYLVMMELHQTGLSKVPESSGSGKRSRQRQERDRDGESMSGRSTPDTPMVQRNKLPLPPPLTRAPVAARSGSSVLRVARADESGRHQNQQQVLRPPPPLTALRPLASASTSGSVGALPPPPPLYAQTSSGMYVPIMPPPSSGYTLPSGMISATHVPLANGKTAILYAQLDEGKDAAGRPRRTLKKSAKLLYNEQVDYHYEMTPERKKMSTNGIGSPPSSVSSSSDMPGSTNPLHTVPVIIPLAPAHTSDTRKTVWKCKKCLFRDTNKDVVLAHVKEHYRGSSKENAVVHPPFQCGHCAQVSNWKHVIQRHCRLKHDGDIRVVENKPNDDDAPEAMPEDEAENLARQAAAANVAVAAAAANDNVVVTDGLGEEIVVEPHHFLYDDDQQLYECRVCPFTCKQRHDMESHQMHHVLKPDAVFKCIFCPYFVDEKRQLVQHVRLHGVEESDECGLGLVSKTSKVPPDETITSEEVTHAKSGEGKKYKCASCPYVSDSRSQFLYHKQFHRPRGAPFKCPQCSYNVTRRHLLHQHLRVHGMTANDLVRFLSTGESTTDQASSPAMARPQLSDSDTLKLPDIPLVWVSRNGKYYKMFKCRYCPHVNLRKVNIQEHEKMHRHKATSGEQHRCPHCNYSCNNAGVLSAHLKVHQNALGEVHALVDTSKSDESQLQEITGSTASIAQTPAVESAPNMELNVSGTSSPAGQTALPADRMLFFCQQCPARFFYEKELSIHRKFHGIRLIFKCEMCTYAARQKPHLLAHIKVHTKEYQERTKVLLQHCKASAEYPQPKVFAIQTNSFPPHPIQEVPPVPEIPVTPPPVHMSGGDRPYFCDRCPARFAKPLALQYHLSLHGGKGPHRCDKCDYGVKTYGNLVRHKELHNAIAHMPLESIQSPPTSASETPTVTQAAKVLTDEDLLDCEIARRGNPVFIYPTCMKNGKVKEKRYKCQKCPSAFEKYEQYKIHIALHGSQQKYRCDKCDYSVKYYANYIQHMRKHKRNEEAQRAKHVGHANQELLPVPGNNNAFPTMQIVQDISGPMEIKPELTTADKQQQLLRNCRKEITASPREEERRIFYCEYCPYSNVRRDAVENHSHRHAVSSGANNFSCHLCDYTVPQQHFLREHIKVHFRPSKFVKPEAFTHMDNLCLWVKDDPEEKENGLSGVPRRYIFNDDGKSHKKSIRMQQDDCSGIPCKKAKIDVDQSVTTMPVKSSSLPDIFKASKSEENSDHLQGAKTEDVSNGTVSME